MAAGALLAVISLLAQAGASRPPPLDVRAQPSVLAPMSLDGPWRFRVGDERPEANQGPTPYQMPVPSNWYERGLDVDGVVWFSRTVDVTTSLPHGVLRFEGVDYEARVYWDGALVGEHRGYFAPFSCDLGAVAAGPHALSVRVDSPRETKEAFSLRKTLVKGVLAHHDTRPGGAWSERGQDANTGGIWGNVSLEEGGGAAVEDTRVSTIALSQGAAAVRVSARVRSRGEAASVRYAVRDPEGGVVAEGTLATVKAGDGPRLVETTLAIAKPSLWWPREIGPQPLYSLGIEVASETSRTQSTLPFGIRTVVRDGKSKLLVNGTPVFLRGVNYIGSLYLASLGTREVKRDLDLMVAAHVNAVRVHAHVTAPAFYELTDALGILVWQDFPLQWGYDPSAAFTEEAARQAGEMVATLGHHPSIVFWSADNEAPWSSDWMKWKYADYDPDQNRTLDAVLEERLAAEDPSRPSQGNAHPAEHAWSGWYEGTYRDFAKATAQPFVTEFGAQALPALPTLRTIFRANELWPIRGENAKVWDYHNFQLHETRDIARVPIGSSIEDLISNTQSYQSKLTQFAAENLRRQKWQPVSGIFQFMFVEHWPSVSWGVVDYQRHTKPGYDALARAYQPVIAVAHRKPKDCTLAVDVVDDRLTGTTDGTLRVVYGEGKESAQRDFPLTTRANGVTPLPEAIACPRKGAALRLSVIDARGVSVSINEYAPEYFER